MKIYIRDHRIRFWILIPGCLVFNRTAAKLGAYAAKRSGYPVEAETISRFLLEARRIQKKYPGLALVDVESSDQQKVKVIL